MGWSDVDIAICLGLTGTGFCLLLFGRLFHGQRHLFFVFSFGVHGREKNCQGLGNYDSVYEIRESRRTKKTALLTVQGLGMANSCNSVQLNLLFRSDR